jgi:mannose-6-phosphate isomerase-like protein (cupin superfamily)
MFRQGDVYHNPVTGERVTIRLGARETKSERLIVDLQLRGGGIGFPLHLHPTIHERLMVTSGRVGVHANGVISIAKIGQTIDIPPGMAHRFWNAGICEATLTIDILPGKRYEELLHNMIGLAQDGKTNSRGMPSLLQLAALATEFDDVIHFVEPLRFAQRAFFPPLALIAKLRGYQGSYREFALRLPSERHVTGLKPRTVGDNCPRSTRGLPLPLDSAPLLTHSAALIFWRL